MSYGHTISPARPTIQKFSSAYDVCELRVRPTGQDSVRINDATYRRLQCRTAQPNPRRPVFARLPGHALHFEFEPDDRVPLEHLEMPNRVVDDLNIAPVPSFETVLVARPRHAVRLIRLARAGEASLN